MPALLGATAVLLVAERVLFTERSPLPSASTFAASLVPDVWIAEGVTRAWELDSPWMLVVSIVLSLAGTVGRGA